jgi:hypothetical protein
MAARTPDPWRAAVEVTDAAAAARAAHPELVDRLAVAARPFESTGTDVAGLLDEVDRRAVIDVDAPLESSRPVVPQLKGAVRKAGAFVARHLAQQTTVLVSGLSAAVRLLDARVHQLERAGHLSILSSVPDVRPSLAGVLADLERDRPGTRRDVGSPTEVATLPRGAASVVVAYRLLDVGPLGARLAVVDHLVSAVAPGGWLAVVSVAPSAWADVADPVVRDLGAPGPLHPQTWSHLLTELGGTNVRVHEGEGAHVVAAQW